jgi:hypothetical protein
MGHRQYEQHILRNTHPVGLPLTRCLTTNLRVVEGESLTHEGQAKSGKYIDDFEVLVQVLQSSTIPTDGALFCKAVLI